MNRDEFEDKLERWAERRRQLANLSKPTTWRLNLIRAGAKRLTAQAAKLETALKKREGYQQLTNEIRQLSCELVGELETNKELPNMGFTPNTVWRRTKNPPRLVFTGTEDELRQRVEEKAPELLDVLFPPVVPSLSRDAAKRLDKETQDKLGLGTSSDLKIEIKTRPGS